MKCNCPLTIITCTGIWVSSYKILRILLPEKNLEYCSRIVSLIHALIATAFGIPNCFSINNNLYEWEAGSNLNEDSCLLVASLSYFLYDIIICIYDPNETNLMVLHHIFSVFTLEYVLLNSFAGLQATCNLGLMEITNPLLQLRWFIREQGYYPSLLHSFTEFSFFISFVIVRVFWGTYYLYNLYLHEQPKAILVLFSSLYVVSLIFVLLMIKYAIQGGTIKD